MYLYTSDKIVVIGETSEDVCYNKQAANRIEKNVKKAVILLIMKIVYT